MSKYSLTHLSDGALLQGLKEQAANDWATTALMLAHIAEVDARKLYLPAAYPSMTAYCMGELHFSEDAAGKRIHAARAGRDFPAIFAAVAEGRLHLSGVVMLAPRLTPENADELIASATHKSKSEIEQLLAERFPRADVPIRISALSPGNLAEHAPGRVAADAERAPGRVEPAKVTPLAPERYALQCTVSQGTYELLQYAQALLGHQVAPKDLPAVIDRALKALVDQLEKSKFAKTSRPRAGARRGASARHIPAEVKRQVWERDHGQCTFVSEQGQRCPARSRLEFDHIEPVARGGTATVGSIRIRCRAHNQYEAERVFGVPFMNHKRAEAKRASAARKQEVARTRPRDTAGPEPHNDVIPWLRGLAFRPDEARRAASLCDSVPDAPLEERVRVALRSLAPRSRKIPAPRTVSRQAPQPHAQL